MHERHPFITSLVRSAFCLTALLAAGLALYPNLQLPEPSLTRGFTDKIYHVVGCMVLVLLAAKGWRIRMRIVVFALPLSPLLEFVQGVSPGRGVHLLDMAANLTGVTLALLILGVTFSRRSRPGKVDA